MKDAKTLLVPVVLTLLLVPIFVVALIVYDPGGDSACDCAGTLPVMTHSHGVGLVTAIQSDMQLILNISPAAQLYQVVDGKLELCGDVDDPVLKHVTVDVNDARLALGERLPVDVRIEIRDSASGAIIVQADAPAMYAPGHGYHFGDNFFLPNDATYDWMVTISPVQALRQAGALDFWLEPVVWTGSFALDMDGNPVDKRANPQLVGQTTDQGIHVMLSVEDAQALYAVTDDGQTVQQDAPPGSRYFVVDVTDHTVNYEEKLPGAEITVTFVQGDTEIAIPFNPVISPVYGYHYGANVALDPGAWTITVEVRGLDFLRHAGPAVSLARGLVSGTFAYTVG